jgi:hypothetical protein
MTGVAVEIAQEGVVAPVGPQTSLGAVAEAGATHDEEQSGDLAGVDRKQPILERHRRPTERR